MSFLDGFEELAAAFVPRQPRRRTSTVLPPERLFNWDKMVDAEVRLMDAKTRQIEALVKLEEARSRHKDSQDTEVDE